MWGEQSVQGEVGTLVFSERRSLVQHGKVNQVEAGESGLQDSLSCDAIFHASPPANGIHIVPQFLFRSWPKHPSLPAEWPGLREPARFLAGYIVGGCWDLKRKFRLKILDHINDVGDTYEGEKNL